MKKAILSTLVLSPLLLGGCASISGYDAETDFVCAAPKGVSCSSISGVHASAKANSLPSQKREGEIGLKEDYPSPSSSYNKIMGFHDSGAINIKLERKTNKKKNLPPPAALHWGVGSTGLIVGSTPTSGTPIYEQPKVIRVWFTPWEDKDAMLHDQSFVYFTAQKGRWKVTHIKNKIIEDSKKSVVLEEK